MINGGRGIHAIVGVFPLPARISNPHRREKYWHAADGFRLDRIETGFPDNLAGSGPGCQRDGQEQR
jgi:hypothetical protein